MRSDMTAWAHDDACACGHTFVVHQHHRRGSDCGVCGKAKCPTYEAFVQRPWWKEIVHNFKRGWRDGGR